MEEDSTGTAETRRLSPRGLSPLFIFLHGELIYVSIFHQQLWTSAHKGNGVSGGKIAHVLFLFSSFGGVGVRVGSWSGFFRFFSFQENILLLCFRNFCWFGGPFICPGKVSADIEEACKLGGLATLFERLIIGLELSSLVKEFQRQQK